MRLRDIGLGIGILLAFGAAAVFATRTLPPDRKPVDGDVRAIIQAASVRPPSEAPSQLRREELRGQVGALVEQMWRADAPPAIAGPALAPMPDPSQPGYPERGKRLSTYVAERLDEEFRPLARQCYEVERARNPSIGPTITMKFRLVDDQRSGGLVDLAEVEDQEGRLSREFSECMSESIKSVSFGAFPKSHPDLEMTYPMDFDGAEDASVAEATR